MREGIKRAVGLLIMIAVFVLWSYFCMQFGYVIGYEASPTYWPQSLSEVSDE